MITLHACLAAGLLASTCYALPGNFHLSAAAQAGPPSPPLPPYATQEWIHYAASIVAGETVPECEVCDRWIACTIKRDIEGGRHPWTLHPGRWHGYSTPSPPHRAAVEAALHPQGCLDVPVCTYLGNLNDYRYWAAGRLAQNVSCHLVGNARGAIVCIPPARPPLPVLRQTGARARLQERRAYRQAGGQARAGPATPSPVPNPSTTASTEPRRPQSPAPARPGPVCQSLPERVRSQSGTGRRPGHACE